MLTSTLYATGNHGRTGETYETFTTVCEFAHEEHQCENAFAKISIISR